MAYIDKITNKDTGESRPISPAADKVRVDNENFEGIDLDEVLDEIADAIEEAGGEGGYTPPQGGIPKTDLAPAVQTSLDKADSAYQKPASGIPATDIADGVIPDVSGFATKTEVQQGLASKVDKTDYTDTDKNKLRSLPANPVTSISVNGQTPQTPTQGNVNIEVGSGSVESVTVNGTKHTPDANGDVDLGTIVGQKGDKGDTGNVVVTDGVAQIGIINDLTTGGAGDALSAEMGKRLRNKIIELEDNFQDLVSKLANLAFVGTKPTYPDIDWSAPKHTVAVDLSGSQNVSVEGTWPKQVVEGQEITITITPNGENTLSSVVYKIGMNGQEESANVVNNQAVITINVTADITVYITAVAGLRIWKNMSLTAYGIPVSDEGACYTDFVKLDGLSNNVTANWVYNFLATPTASLNGKRGLCFYDKNKRMLFYASQWDAKWTPLYLSSKTDNSRTVDSTFLSTMFNTVGQDTPMYARFSFAMSGDGIASGCGFTQGSTQFVPVADAIIENTAEVSHGLSFNLTHCTTTATGYQNKVLDGQPIEVLIQAASGYSLSNLTVSVTVGGEQVTANISDYSYGGVSYKKVVVENITGDVVVTASI